MFKFLRDKLKGALAKFAKKIEEAPEEKIEVQVEEAREEKGEAALAEKPNAEELLEAASEYEKKAGEGLDLSLTVKEAVELEEPAAAEEELPEIVEEKKTVGESAAEKVKAAEAVEEAKVEAEKDDVRETRDEERSKGFFAKLKEKIVGRKEEVGEREKVEKAVEDAEKKGMFAKIKQAIVTKKISEQKFNEMFWELEVALLENNVAVEVIEKIKEDLKEEIVEKPILRGSVDRTIANALKKSIEELFDIEGFNLLEKCKSKKPLVICFVGVNGSGKTTTIAKMAKLLQDNNLSCVIAAADTFRAAAIDQLERHGEKLGVKVIKHDYGADAAAVAFDAIKHAEAKGKDVVLIDTAGRLHSNTNLMDEMKKVVRVAKPDVKIFVGESITGNDCIEQAKQFDEAIGIDAIVLSKADIDEKGGAAISISYVTKKPIIYLGVGQGYDDLKPFDANVVIEGIGLEA